PEESFNEIINIFDLYLHPATSGACELPLVESALTEKIVATCNYSFGEDVIELNKGSIPLDFTFYTEHNTQFLKSQPFPFSIAKVIKKVYYMKPEKRKEMEKLSRKWALDNYSIEINGKKIEEFLDSVPSHTWDFNTIYKPKNVDYPFKGKEFNSDFEFIKDLYFNILYLFDEKTEDSPGVLNWLNVIKNGGTREGIWEFFIKTAKEENAKNIKINYEDFFDKDDKGKRLLFSIPESFGDCYLCTSLFPSLKEIYPDYHLYVACKGQYKDVFNANKYVHKVIEWIPQLDNIFMAEGQGNYDGFVDIHLMPYVNTQRIITYTHSGKDKGNIELNASH
ncbi:MAG: hypothetical protein AABY22_17975, partial [Nanoarchaeota archaeon]